MPTSSRKPRAKRAVGFTLTELIVAVTVLVVILLATGRILSTASRVTGLGEANADVLQELAAVGTQLRADLANISRESVFAIRCVAVPNDINGPALLNPLLPPEAYIRADQLLFFKNADQSVSTFRTGRRADQRAQAALSRVYYGHAFQLIEAGDPADFTPLPRAFDVAPDEVVFPWTSSFFAGSIDTVRTIYDGNEVGNSVFTTSSPSESDLEQVNATDWLMVRQAVSLVDDDYGPVGGNNKTQFLGDVLSARSIFLEDPISGPSPQIRDGRIDAAATELGDIRRRIQYKPNGDFRPWSAISGGSTLDQRSLIANELLYYPRAEVKAPSNNRVDQALTNNVILTACSSIKIDWTYYDGVGFAQDAYGTQYPGIEIDPTRAQPWFGMPDAARYADTGRIDPDFERGVGAYGDDDYQAPNNDDYYFPAATILPIGDVPSNVEHMTTLPGNIVVYEAIFGYNQTEALDATGVPNVDLGYTPWPSALRVTLTLHDSQNTLENGREVEFVIDLPSAGR